MGLRLRLVAERFCKLPIAVDAWEISHTASPNAVGPSRSGC